MLTITNEDNMELMKRYPNKYFELAIVDPPYGIGMDSKSLSNIKSNSEKFKNCSGTLYAGKWKDDKPANKTYFNELKRVSKNQIIWGANHFIENIPNANSSSWIVWYKKGQNPNAKICADCELAYTSFKTSVKYFRYDWTGFGAINAKETKIHPTQKPVALYKWLLKNYAKEGDKILDTHLGSGSIAIACHYMGFDLTACELDKEYYDMAMQRITDQTRQLTLL
jgi:site-specific DNA-methyltransferase (adenine-specific)